MIKKTAYIIIIILVSGLSGIVADRYLFPYLSTSSFFAKYKFLKKSTENVTIINKTEQVYVKEETSLTKLTNQIASSIVNIVSYTETANTLKVIGKNTINPVSTFKNGTGMIVTSDGIIITYASAIITGNAKYKIMTDNNTYDAEMMGTDPYSNLAFIKISASNLPVVSFANSDDFKAGEKVIAIGNGMEKYQNTYSSGLINDFNYTFNLSGKTLSSSEKLEGIIETDIDSKNLYVGGPIVDYSGQVIGITGSVEKDNKTVFFQIPSNKVKLVLDKAIKKELDQASQLGVYYVSLTKTYALTHKLNTEKGALIYSPSGQQGLAIIAGSPAAKAGLKINDIITAINGEEINVEHGLSDLLYKYKKGQEVELTVLREGQEIKVKINL